MSTEQKTGEEAMSADLAVIKNALAELDADGSTPTSTLVTLTETWLSNMLAYLLDPRAPHGLGVSFARGFVKAVAACRTDGSNPDGLKYARRAKHLKQGKSGRGTTATGLALGNAATCREFFLGGEVRRVKADQRSYVDVVLFDLDSSDGLLLLIENKLFTTNHPGQLERYYRLAEKRFSRAKVLEYVYLTPLGHAPKAHTEQTGSGKNEHWVCMSWHEDVLEVLRGCTRDRARVEPAVADMLALLEWMNAAANRNDLVQQARMLGADLLSTARACLLTELNRLCKKGEWRPVGDGKTLQHIAHSSTPKRKLKFSLLPNGSVIVRPTGKKTSRKERLLIPFGSNPHQTFHLLDMVARDLYPFYFGEENHKRYLGSRRKLTSNFGEGRQEFKKLLRFVHLNRYTLAVLLALSGALSESDD